MAFTKSKGRAAKYGAQHQAERRARAARHKHTDPCVRCKRPLGPMSPALHLDHDEHGGYLGFAHDDCNRKAGARKGARVANTRRAAPAFFQRPRR
jgi:hypothetical protein